MTTDLHKAEKVYENIRLENIDKGLNKITKLCRDGSLLHEHHDIILDRLAQGEKVIDSIAIFEGQNDMFTFIDEATNKHISRIGVKPFDSFDTHKVTVLFGTYQPKTRKIKNFAYMNRNGVMQTEIMESCTACDEDGVAIPMFINNVIICEVEVEIATRPNNEMQWYKPADVMGVYRHIMVYVPTTEKGENK